MIQNKRTYVLLLISISLGLFLLKQGCSACKEEVRTSWSQEIYPSAFCVAGRDYLGEWCILLIREYSSLTLPELPYDARRYVSFTKDITLSDLKYYDLSVSAEMEASDDGHVEIRIDSAGQKPNSYEPYFMLYAEEDANGALLVELQECNEESAYRFKYLVIDDKVKPLLYGYRTKGIYFSSFLIALKHYALAIILFLLCFKIIALLRKTRSEPIPIE